MQDPVAYRAPMTNRALVLGAGGVTGVAWELGVLAGLADAGIDLSAADLYVGSSAGSVVATMLTSGVDLDEQYARQLAPPTGEPTARLGIGNILRWAWAGVGTRDARKIRARIGALALRATTMPEAERRQLIESRLPAHDWPRQRLLVTAVDAVSGEFVVFERDSGVSLVDAVGASCAVPGVWPPVTINGRRYIDGGVRSPANLDLASGCDRIIAITPITRAFRAAAGVARQAAALAVPVAVVAPDRAARRAIGRNVLDPARRAAAARAGREQAARIASTVAEVWAPASV
jgi:NTE family protein